MPEKDINAALKLKEMELKMKEMELNATAALQIKLKEMEINATAALQMKVQEIEDKRKRKRDSIYSFCILFFSVSLYLGLTGYVSNFRDFIQTIVNVGKTVTSFLNVSLVWVQTALSRLLF